MASSSSSPTASPATPRRPVFGRGRLRYPPTELLFDSEGTAADGGALLEIRGEEEVGNTNAVPITGSQMEIDAVLAALDTEDDGTPVEPAGGPEPAVFISNAEYVLQHERECGEMIALHHEDGETQAFFDGERAQVRTCVAPPYLSFYYVVSDVSGRMYMRQPINTKWNNGCAHVLVVFTIIIRALSSLQLSCECADVVALTDDNRKLPCGTEGEYHAWWWW